MGRAVFPPCCLTWGQTMVEVMKIMVTSFKRFHAHTAALSASDPAAGHRQPSPLPETPGHAQASLAQSLVGSLLLSPGSQCTQGSSAHKVLFVLSKSLFPQSCVSSGGSVLGLMVTSSRGLMPCPGLLHPEPLPLWQTADLSLHRRHSHTVLAQSLWGLWVLVHTRFVWALWASLVGMEFDSKLFLPFYHLAGASPLPLEVGYRFLVGSNILLSTVVRQQVVILEFS